MIIEKIPMGDGATRVRFPAIRFAAPFGVGVYDFGIAANQNIELIPLQNNSRYLITAISFFANVADSDWLEGMDTAANFPAFRLHYENSPSSSIFPEPVQCVNYVDGQDTMAFFKTERKDEKLLISFSGVVNQTAGMVGVDPLLAEVNFTMYQISAEQYNRQFNEGRI